MLFGLMVQHAIVQDFMSHCTIGLSGVLFSLLVLKCHLAPQPFSFFGFGKGLIQEFVRR